jgi:hypothetical protein
MGFGWRTRFQIIASEPQVRVRKRCWSQGTEAVDIS